MLRLPEIVDRVPVRHVIHLPPELDQALRDYAKVYADTYGASKPVADLIPAMIATFIDGDRQFSRWRRSRTHSKQDTSDG